MTKRNVQTFTKRAASLERFAKQARQSGDTAAARRFEKTAQDCRDTVAAYRDSKKN